ncbi:MAG: hypothetical protein OXN88_10845 [Chloroflexota bacterium]|nr:hypothetical protein [Chloroflexota bacterium]
MSPSASQARGLFHSAADLQLARSKRESEPIRGALARLENSEEDPLARAQLAAMRGQFHDDAQAGHAAAAALADADFGPAALEDLAGLKRALGWLSLIAMLRDHPAWQPAWRDRVNDVRAWLDEGRQPPDVEGELWRGALQLAAGALLDNDEAIEQGAAVYRRAVDEIIHPEGYLKGIADIADAPARFEAQLSGACALVLLAEMAGLLGLDLWFYDSRAVSVITAVTYTHYYYFFPEKWRWEAGLTRARTMAAVRREGAFLEMVNRRRPPQGIEALFTEQRPLFCAHGGGLTTLTHGLMPEKKRRWRLW